MSGIAKNLVLGAAVFGALYTSAVGSAYAESRPKLLVSVGGQRLDNKIAAQSVCKNFFNAASAVAPYDVECVRLDDFDEMLSDRIGKAEASGKFRMHFMLRGVSYGYVLKLENWGREDDAEIDRMQWKVNTPDLSKATDQINGIITNALSFDQHKAEVKALFLGSALGSSQAIQVDEKGVMREKATGRILGDKEAYEMFVNESPQQKNAMRALTQIGVGIGLATLNYWRYTLFKNSSGNPNEIDWHYEGWEGQKRRYRGFNGVRMDDNSRDTNMGHSLAGTFYYQVARANGFNTLESTLISFTASTFWEVVSEYREVISINDTFFTPIGGLAIGEVGHQFGSYFYSKDNLMGKVLSTFFDAPSSFNRMMDGFDRSKSRAAARMDGFDPESMKGYADFYIGKTSQKNAALLNDGQEAGNVFGLRGEIVKIPYYDSEGRERNLYTNTALSQVLLQFTNSKNATTGAEALFKSILAAYHQRDISVDAAGRKNGYSMMIGLSNAFSYDYTAADKADRTDDWIASVHVLGGSLDVTAYVQGVQIRAAVDVYGDFAMVRSYAIDAYKKANEGSEDYQRTLEEHSYYYYQGVTSAASISAKVGRLSAGVSAKASDYRSVEGHDQHHDTLQNELKLRDQASKAEVWMAYDISRSWKARVSIEHRKRSGSINGDYQTEGSDRRVTGTLIYRF